MVNHRAHERDTDEADSTFVPARGFETTYEICVATRRVRSMKTERCLRVIGNRVFISTSGRMENFDDLVPLEHANGTKHTYDDDAGYESSDEEDQNSRNDDTTPKTSTWCVYVLMYTMIMTLLATGAMATWIAMKSDVDEYGFPKFVYIVPQDTWVWKPLVDVVCKTWIRAKLAYAEFVYPVFSSDGYSATA